VIKTFMRSIGAAGAVLAATAAPALATTHYAAANGKSIYWPCTSPSTPSARPEQRTPDSAYAGSGLPPEPRQRLWRGE
jgi:hypothetical protein